MWKIFSLEASKKDWNKQCDFFHIYFLSDYQVFMVWQNKLFYFSFVQSWRLSSVTPAESYFCHFKLDSYELCARKKLFLQNKSRSLTWNHTYGGSTLHLLLSCSVFLCWMLVMLEKKTLTCLSGMFFLLWS